MLRWTDGGAVASPTVVQIRVQRRYRTRVRAGAPLPSRSMDPQEVRANIRHFTAGMRGPRSRPCTGLVLSGQGVGSRADLVGAVDEARREGVTRVVLHLDPADLDGFDARLWLGRADVLVLPLRTDASLAATRTAASSLVAAGLPLSTHTVLDGDTLGALDDLAASLRQLRPQHHTFTFPFPTDQATADGAPDPVVAAAAIEGLVGSLAGMTVAIKGLPACYLDRARPLLRRTGNRWYVDADHQCDRALLFFPDVVAFHKGEACRFCAASDACDGFFSVYLDRRQARPLEPVDAALLRCP